MAFGFPSSAEVSSKVEACISAVSTGKTGRPHSEFFRLACTSLVMLGVLWPMSLGVFLSIVVLLGWCSPCGADYAEFPLAMLQNAFLAEHASAQARSTMSTACSAKKGVGLHQHSIKAAGDCVPTPACCWKLLCHHHLVAVWFGTPGHQCLVLWSRPL